MNGRVLFFSSLLFLTVFSPLNINQVETPEDIPHNLKLFGDPLSNDTNGWSWEYLTSGHSGIHDGNSILFGRPEIRNSTGVPHNIWIRFENNSEMLLNHYGNPIIAGNQIGFVDTGFGLVAINLTNGEAMSSHDVSIGTTYGYNTSNDLLVMVGGCRCDEVPNERGLFIFNNSSLGINFERAWFIAGFDTSFGRSIRVTEQGVYWLYAIDNYNLAINYFDFAANTSRELIGNLSNIVKDFAVDERELMLSNNYGVIEFFDVNYGEPTGYLDLELPLEMFDIPPRIQKLDYGCDGSIIFKTGGIESERFGIVYNRNSSRMLTADIDRFHRPIINGCEVVLDIGNDSLWLVNYSSPELTEIQQEDVVLESSIQIYYDGSEFELLQNSLISSEMNILHIRFVTATVKLAEDDSLISLLISAEYNTSHEMTNFSEIGNEEWRANTTISRLLTSQFEPMSNNSGFSLLQSLIQDDGSTLSPIINLEVDNWYHGLRTVEIELNLSQVTTHSSLVIEPSNITEIIVLSYGNDSITNLYPSSDSNSLTFNPRYILFDNFLTSSTVNHSSTIDIQIFQEGNLLGTETIENTSCQLSSTHISTIAGSVNITSLCIVSTVNGDNNSGENDTTSEEDQSGANENPDSETQQPNIVDDNAEKIDEGILRGLSSWWILGLSFFIFSWWLLFLRESRPS